MKKIVYVVLAIMLLTVAISAFAGCAKDDGDVLLECRDANFGNNQGNVVSGLSAYDLIMETYSNFLKDRNYTREEFFAFRSSVATRDTYLLRKITGDEIYNQEVIVGTGFDKGTCAKRFYYDGVSAHELNNTNTKKGNIAYKKDTKEFIVKDWGEFKDFDGDLDAKIYELRDKITAYDIMDRSCLSAKHDDNVYEKEGVYYCRITIDCSTEKMNGMQYAAKKEFIDTLSAKETGFSIDDTTIDFAIKKIDGVYKFLIWKRSEKYSGKHASTGLTVSCRQECLCYYEYGNAEVSKDDLLNLA